MQKKIFREKSIKRVSSPEELTDYIRVSDPGVWMLLAAVIILLAGICVWGVFGKMETKLKVAAISANGALICYVKEADITSVKTGMTVIMGGEEYSVTEISAAPQAVDDGINAYALHIGDLQSGEWVYSVSIDGEIPDGVYTAEMITDSVAPMTFVFN